MRRKSHHIVKITFIIIILLTVYGCKNNCSPNLNLSDLFIKDDDLPIGWMYTDKGWGSDEDRSFDSSRGIYFLDENLDTRLQQEVYRHTTITDAKDDFQNELVIGNQDNYPSDWKYRGSTADESLFFCEERENYQFCMWIARYNCIVIDIKGLIGVNQLTLQNMENIVRKVDEKASQLISKE